MHITPEKQREVDAALDHHALILFDGVCNLCNSSVNFVIDRDKHGRFRYASLQSGVGSYVMQRFGLSSQETDSVVLIENHTIYLRSTAALRIARQLSGPVKLLYSFVMVPRLIRDPVYNVIARNRYKWFGRREECRVPTPELSSLFIE